MVRSEEIKEGLKGVVAGTSNISYVFGEEGRLIYRGYDIHDLGRYATFEEVIYLLWHGELPTQTQLDELRRNLTENYPVPDDVLDLIRKMPQQANPMGVLRTAVSLLGNLDPEADENGYEANLRKAIRLTAKMPTIIAAQIRADRGQDFVAPDPRLGISANFLYMIRGETPPESFVKSMDMALVLHADHEFNASTFTARTTVSTLSDLYSGIVAAIGALKGPLHGGANEQVMRMLLEIKKPENVRPWIEDRIAQGRKIPGFGHRVYRTEDPRAKFLREKSYELSAYIGEKDWYEMLRELEQVAYEKKGLYCNVDLYSGSIYYAMGIPLEYFTPIFALSRVAGWTAHILEQYEDNKLIRPRAVYTGPTSREYVPLSRRR